MKKSKRSMENNSDTKKVKNSFSAWFEDLKEFMSGRFSLEEDKAQRDEVVATVEKGVVFRGVNLWVLIFATMIASLGLNAHLEEEMARLREAVLCEWTETVNTPSAQTRFKHFINSDKRDPNVQMVPEREQHRPATPYERIPVTLVEDNA